MRAALGNLVEGSKGVFRCHIARDAILTAALKPIPNPKILEKWKVEAYEQGKSSSHALLTLCLTHFTPFPHTFPKEGRIHQGFMDF